MKYKLFREGKIVKPLISTNINSVLPSFVFAAVIMVLQHTNVYSQKTVTIGSEYLNENAVLMLVASGGDQGFILPIVTSREKIGVTSVDKGMIVFDDNDDRIYLWDGRDWLDLVSEGNIGVNSLNDLDDVSIDEINVGQILKWSGTGWVAAKDETGTGSDNQTLSFDNVTNILSIENGNEVDLSSLSNPLYTAGEGITISDSYVISNSGDGDDSPTNEIQSLAFDVNTRELSISDGNTVVLPPGGTDADSDPTNELQDLSLSGMLLTLSGDDTSVDLSSVISPGGTDDQTASEVAFDNINTNFNATNVQEALVELSNVTGSGGLWKAQGNNAYYDQGYVGIGTNDPLELFHINIPEGNTLDNKGVLINQGFSGSSSTYGLDIDLNGTGAGQKFGSSITVENGENSKIGQSVIVNQQSNSMAYGVATSLTSNTNQVSAGFYSINQGVGLGDKYGVVSGLQSGDGLNKGLYSFISGGSEVYGLHSIITQNAGTNIGMLSEVYETTSTSSKGFESRLNNSGEMVGFNSHITQDNDILESYGFKSQLINNNSGGNSFGLHSIISGSGEGEKYGIRSDISGAGPGEKFGVWSQLYEGTGSKTGVYSRVLQPGNEPSYGFYSDMVNNGDQPAYGIYSKFDSDALGEGSKIGGYFDVEGRGGSILQGVVTSISTESTNSAIGYRSIISGPGTGNKAGFESRITDGDGSKIGYSSSVVQDFPRTTYGFESVITNNSNGSSVGLRLRVIDNVNEGVAYGIVSSGDELSTFDGSIRVGNELEGKMVKVGTWHFVNNGGSPADLLLYNGNSIRGFFDGVSGSYSNVSDQRLKKNTHDMERVLFKIKQLKPTRYQFKNGNRTDVGYIGFIAQEVKSLFPELVTVHESDELKDLHTLDYSGFGVLAIKAIQEQQELIESQERYVKTLEKKLEALSNKLEQALK